MKQWSRPSSPPKSLIEAAAWGDIEAVRRFLVAGANVRERDNAGWTPLHHAVGYGDTPGMDVITARRPVRGVVKALLEAGAPLNAIDRSGNTPLILAVSAHHEVAARWLVEAGADLKWKDKFGGTVLTHALWYEHCSKGFVQYLRQEGAPLNLWDALWLGDTANALPLVWQVELDTTGPNGFTYLHLAALLSNAKVAARLIARKANVNARADYGWTPLHVACGGTPIRMPLTARRWHTYGISSGRRELVRLLLKYGASRIARDDKQRTPRDWAVGLERKELIPLLG